MTHSVAIDVGGTSVKLGLVDEDWVVIERTSLDTERDASFDDFADQIGEAVADLASRPAIIGISAPGAHDFAGVVVAGGDNVPFLTQGSLPQALARRFDAHVAMENDGICATAAELLFGAGRDRDRFVVATLGTGIGGAVVLGGRILAGRHAIPPEFGELCVDPSRTDLPGNIPGRLEHFGSATALGRLYRERAPDAPDDLAADQIIDRAKDGERAACAAVDEMTDRLGQAFGFMVNVLDLEAIVIGGGLSQAGAWLAHRISVSLARYVHRFEERGIAVVPAEAGNDAGMLGGVAFARGRMAGLVQRGEKRSDADAARAYSQPTS